MFHGKTPAKKGKGANQWTGFYMIGTSVMKELTGLYAGYLKLEFPEVKWKSKLFTEFLSHLASYK